MYCPADFDSDSEEEYDGFYFGSPKVKKDHRIVPQQQINAKVNKEDLIYQAVNDGDIDAVKQFFKDNPKWPIDQKIKEGWSLLMYACDDAFADIVDYLLKERNADPNRGYMSWTPLMLACKSRESSAEVLATVKVLLEHGAVINVCNDLGNTPLMYATIEGHTEVVELFMDQASLESTDHEGLTALFYAIKNKRVEICKMLLKAGADTDIVNTYGITPKQEAKFIECEEIADLFPEDDVYIMPQKYYNYNDIRDVVHGENDKDMPEYCPDIGVLLFGCTSEGYLRKFSENNFTLEEFLTVTNQRMKDIGIEFPFVRKRIMLGLIRFHEKMWSSSCVQVFGGNQELDLFDVLEMTAGNLKHLIIIKTSLMFLKNFDQGNFVRFQENEIDINLKRVKELKNAIQRLRRNVQKIHETTSVKPVDLIDSTPTYRKYTFASLCLNSTITLSILYSLACGLLAYIYKFLFKTE